MHTSITADDHDRAGHPDADADADADGAIVAIGLAPAPTGRPGRTDQGCRRTAASS